MLHHLISISSALISPLLSAMVGLLLCLGLAGAGFRRTAGVIGVLSVSWLWTWSTPAASTRLRAHMESTFPPRHTASIEAAEAIVVLGGAISPAHMDRQVPQLTSAADRLLEAARLYAAGKAPLLVLSGGKDPRNDGSEAEAMRTLLGSWGVPPAAMLLEDRSHTTAENAACSSELLHARGIRKILLVTSAMHMGRARSLFEAAGLQVTAVGADYHRHVAPEGLGAWVPNTEALDVSARALKEWIGSKIVHCSSCAWRLVKCPKAKQIPHVDLPSYLKLGKKSAAAPSAA